eukprot:8208450-Pyramimonas_sp.AAC.1
MTTLTVVDASSAGEDGIVNGHFEPLRPQRARFNGLAGPGFIEGNSDGFQPICVLSKVIRRVCKSLLQAETLAFVWGVGVWCVRSRCHSRLAGHAWCRT